MTNGREVIPSRWNYRKISEVATKVGSGSTPRGGESVYQDSGVPLIRSMNVHSSGFKSDGLAFIDADEAKKLDHVIVQPSDVLLNITGASIGRVTTAPNALAGARVNQHVCIIRPKEELSSSFLSYFLASPKEQAHVMNVQVGATRQALTKAMILDWVVPVPPFHEQQEIVAEIEKQFSRLDEAVANLQRVKANLKRYKAAVLIAAVEGKLTEDWRKQHPDVEQASKLLERILIERRAKWKGKGKYQEPAEPNTSNLPALPEGWTWATAAQLTPADRPCAYGVLQPGDHIEAGVPLVRVGDINDGRVDQSELKRIAPMIAARYPRTRLQGGEVVISLVGAIGRTAVIPQSLKGANTARAVGVIPLTSEVSSQWVEIWFRNPAKVAEMTAKSHEVARKTLNLEDVRDASVAIPPDKEQHQIVAEVERRLSVIEELEAAAEANLTRAERLRQSILSQAFTGKLLFKGARG